MKHLYTTILTLALATSSMMAEEGTFSFVRNGEVIPNGSTITLSEVHCEDLGDMKIWEMPSNLGVKNNEASAQALSLLCTAVENITSDVSVCPDGNCRSWVNGTILADFNLPIAAGATADCQIHVSYTDFEYLPTFSYRSVMKVKAYCTLDEEDFTEITVIFDTSASKLNQLETSTHAEVFNLCGKKIADTTAGLKKGMYIIRQNGVSRKVIIK